MLAGHGMMSSRAAPTGLPGCDQRVRATAPAAGERPGQGRGVPGATTPDHRPGTPTGPDSAAVLPGDRAFLAALLHRLSTKTLCRFRLLVRPETVLRWHRDFSRDATRPSPVPGVPAAREPFARFAFWCYAWRGRIPSGATAAFTANYSYSASRSPPPLSGRSSRTLASIPRPSAPPPPGRPSFAHRLTPCWPATSSRPSP